MPKEVTGLDDCNTDSLGCNTGEENSSDNIFISSVTQVMKEKCTMEVDRVSL